MNGMASGSDERKSSIPVKVIEGHTHQRHGGKISVESFVKAVCLGVMRSGGFVNDREL